MKFCVPAYHAGDAPPSMLMAQPVMKLAGALAKKTIMLAASWLVPMRLTGMLSPTEVRNSS